MALNSGKAKESQIGCIRMKRFLGVASVLLTSLRPKSNKLEIDTYGHNDVDLSPEEIQTVMEWLFASLMNAGYFGKAHLIWDSGDQLWDKPTLTGVIRDEPVFLYRCGDRPLLPPEKCYWRLMSEHPSLRIYQLEMQEDG